MRNAHAPHRRAGPSVYAAGEPSGLLGSVVRHVLHGLSAQRPARHWLGSTTWRRFGSQVVPRMNQRMNASYATRKAVLSASPHSFFSLALRSTAAPGRKAGLGTGFARARGHHAASAAVRFRGQLWLITLGRRQRPQPNSSVERTSNGGAQWLPSCRSATPLAAAHLKR